MSGLVTSTPSSGKFSPPRDVEEACLCLGIHSRDSRVGSLIVCVLQRALHYYPDEDSKLRASNLHVHRGGNCPNTLEVLQQLLRQEQGARPSDRVRPYLVTCLPSRNAPATVRIIEPFGVDISVDFSRWIFGNNNEEPASSYIIRSSATGSSTLVNYNGCEPLSESSPSCNCHFRECNGSCLGL